MTDDEMLAEMWSMTESPIEQALLHALIREADQRSWKVGVFWHCPRCRSADRARGGTGDFSDRGAPVDVWCERCGQGTNVVSFGSSNPETQCIVWLQHQVGRHRVDMTCEVDHTEIRSNEPKKVAKHVLDAVVAHPARSWGWAEVGA